MILIEKETLLPLTIRLTEELAERHPRWLFVAVSDAAGEDHIFGTQEGGVPVFDLLVSTAARFVFVWYCLAERSRVESWIRLSEKSTMARLESLAVGAPLLGGRKVEAFVCKKGSPALDNAGALLSAASLAEYRTAEWKSHPEALRWILQRSKALLHQRHAAKHADKLKHVQGFVLYAGCALDWAFPELGFGMRDIDVNAFFSPSWYTMTRRSYSRPSNIKSFGMPQLYFKGETRTLDLMWNTLHSKTEFSADVKGYVATMRKRSPRWATLSQRPFIDLAAEQVIYTPAWITRLQPILKGVRR